MALLPRRLSFLEKLQYILDVDTVCKRKPCALLPRRLSFLDSSFRGTKEAVRDTAKLI